MGIAYENASGLVDLGEGTSRSFDRSPWFSEGEYLDRSFHFYSAPLMDGIFVLGVVLCSFALCSVSLIRRTNSAPPQAS